MPNPALTNTEKEAALAALKAHGGNKAAAARALGISASTFKHRVTCAEVDTKAAAPRDLAGCEDVAALQDRVYELQQALKSRSGSQLNEEYVKRKIIGISEELETAQPPKWVVTPAKGRGLPGVPTLFCSDWHWGETVFRTQLNGVNEFNMPIARDRARRLVEACVNLLRNYTVNPKYPGIVCALGGDMLTGDIHDELTQTNEVPTPVALLDLYEVLVWCISRLADEFGNVFLPCVAGNHGRLTKKPPSKNRAFTNWDWLLYQFLAKKFESDKRVQFLIPDGPDARYLVYGHRYLLTHGDQFRGGDGQIGALGPITRGNKRKQTRNAQIDQGYDTMMLGHWHQWIPMLDQIVNGSLKGYDEYANSSNFGFQLPIQGLWMTHHKWGITQTWPIYLEERGAELKNEQWVSWKKAA
jgi:transposase-like protein